jgi:hypothetical protein
LKKILEWSATIITLAGALATSLAYDPWNIYILNVGSLLWIIWSVLERKASIALVNAGMLLIYLFGLIQRTDWFSTVSVW